MNIRMRFLGIDPSFGSLGMCLYNTEDASTHYYLITEHPAKKLQNYSSPHLTQYFYMSYDRNDKTVDMRLIRDIITTILINTKPDWVFMESLALKVVSRSASSLAGLNYVIRLACLDNNIPCTTITPTHIKKQFAGSGWATKNEMIEQWLLHDPHASLIDIKKKDDLADAFSLAFIGGQELSTNNLK